MHIVVLTPVLNDWVSAREILLQLDSVFASRADTLSILLIDDGSTESPPPDFATGPFRCVKAIHVLHLKRNLGHQRALAVGFCYIADNIAADAVVVMDSDGEDDPRDVTRLVDRLTEFSQAEPSAQPLVFAERTRRSEALVFRAGYVCYRLLHVLLTGKGIRFGNFSIVPHSRLGALTTDPMLWNHYAASVVGSRLPYVTIPTHRAHRIAGKSRLNFFNLAIHGLSALSCYNEIIGVRLLFVSSLLLGLTLASFIVTLTLRFATDLPIAGWTSLFAGILIILLFQIITLATNFTMQIISARSVQPFLPRRDYVWYVEGLKSLYPRNP